MLQESDSCWGNQLHRGTQPSPQMSSKLDEVLFGLVPPKLICSRAALQGMLNFDGELQFQWLQRGL